MRTFALLLVSVGTIQFLEAAPSALAADVAVTRTKPVSVRVIHHRSRVVRDYDGTPIILRARPMVLRDYGGTRWVQTYDAIPVPQASPRYYFNGQPVQPAYQIRRR